MDNWPCFDQKVGRIASFVFTAISVLAALFIHFTRTSALVYIQQMCITILSGGLLGLFMIGFLTKRVDNFSAFIATAITIVSVIAWLFFKSDFGYDHFPVIASKIPDDFMINVFSNTCTNSLINNQSNRSLLWLAAHFFRRIWGVYTKLLDLSIQNGVS